MIDTQEARSSTLRPAPRNVVRSGLHLLIKLVVVGVLLLWRLKPVVALILVAGGVWWWISGAQMAVPIAASGTRSFERFSAMAAALPPAPAAEQYLWGQSHYDANAMWTALSDEMKRATARSGGMTLQRLEQQLQEAKNSGQRYDPVRYVGGYVASDGRGFYLYVVGVNSGTNTRYVPFTFTISKEGKIVNID